MRRRLGLLALGALALLAGCGGGGGGGGAVGNAGTLRVIVVGLAVGASPSVMVTGPGNVSQALSTTDMTLTLAPGVYTITAGNVLDGASNFAPQQAMQTATVTAGASAAATVTYNNAGAFRLALQQVVAGLADPLFLASPAGDARLFVVERTGRIRIVQNGVVAPAPFLDISARASTAGEGGLLSLAFDPQFATNGSFYVYFTDTTGDVAIERFQVSANPAAADPTPLRIITITHRSFTNHKGGLVAFGPDGFLYLAPGDGGGGGDPLGSGQNLNTLLGKILRIDVSNASAAQPYAIPAGNPFTGQPNRRGEIWGFGLRNPFRYTFDTGTLYIADVGQNRIEEVDAVAASAAGVNYGWNVTEGSLCFPGDPCSTQGITLPVLEYDHGAAGGCSIIGGFVYRGTAIPELAGRYLYSDFCTGFLRTFALRGGSAMERIDWAIPSVGSIFSFGQDAQGELYMLTSTGAVMRVVRQ
ncbi:MAG TPA: PQQ-dependent sugar dehydrogenase [Burkholderiales bacterium]|nr:PQQ-dependent sugar dehydrogenase [Burkholderiales bacterium]